MITGINHINLSVSDIEQSFFFYHDILSFKPLCKSDGSAYFLVGDESAPGSFWLSLDLDRYNVRQTSPCNTHIAFSVDKTNFDRTAHRILDFGTKVFKENTSPGKSLYFLDPDEHKLEIHVGGWQDRIRVKKENVGSWTNVEWFI